MRYVLLCYETYCSNLLVKSQLLYQLSYAPARGHGAEAPRGRVVYQSDAALSSNRGRQARV